MRQRITAILNPMAGQGTAGRNWPILRGQLNHMGQVDLRQTLRPGDGTRLAYEATLTGAELIIAAGGDGTINEILNGIMQADGNGGGRPVLAVLPLGSANDFATGLNICSLEDGLDRLAGGQVHQIDVGVIQSQMDKVCYFCFSGGLGFLALVAFKRYKIHRLRGRCLYFLALLSSIRQIRHPVDMRIVFDHGEVIEQPVLLISVNNTPTVGGFLMTPQAAMNDGLFDVLLSPAPSLVRLPWILYALKRNVFLDIPEFQFRKTRRLSIRADQPVSVHVDGQVYCSQADRISQLEIRLIPRGLRVLA